MSALTVLPTTLAFDFDKRRWFCVPIVSGFPYLFLVDATSGAFHKQIGKAQANKTSGKIASFQISHLG